MPLLEDEETRDAIGWRGSHLDTALKVAGGLQLLLAIIGFIVLRKELDGPLWLMVGLVGLGESVLLLIVLFALALVIEKLEDIRQNTAPKSLR
jgi:hypothetical protein